MERIAAAIHRAVLAGELGRRLEQDCMISELAHHEGSGAAATVLTAVLARSSALCAAAVTRSKSVPSFAVPPLQREKRGVE